MKIQVVNVRIPASIVKWIDSLVASGLYKSRAEAVRSFVREYVKEDHPS